MCSYSHTAPLYVIGRQDRKAATLSYFTQPTPLAQNHCNNPKTLQLKLPENVRMYTGRKALHKCVEFPTQLYHRSKIRKRAEHSPHVRSIPSSAGRHFLKDRSACKRIVYFGQYISWLTPTLSWWLGTSSTSFEVWCLLWIRDSPSLCFKSFQKLKWKSAH